MPNLRKYAKTFKVEDKNSKLISFCIDHEKLLEKYKAIWTNIEDLKNITLNALQVYDDSHIQTKMKAYGYKVYSKCRGSNVPEDDIECESLTAISIDSLLASEKNIICKYI